MILLTLTVTLVLCELVLQAAALASPKIRWMLLPPWRQVLPEEMAVVQPPPFVPDAVLGVRGNPAHAEHDAQGYRNAAVPDRVDIVALGDSQTYGVLQPAGQVWPAALAHLSGRSVYNMGIGAWGPVEYRRCIDQALARRPNTILLGLYFGNDLFDCFRSVYVRGVDTDLADPAVKPLIDEAEAGQPLIELGGKLFASTGRAAAPAGFAETCRAAVSEHCKLYALARLIKNRCFLAPSGNAEDALADWASALAWAKERPRSCASLDLGTVRTVLTAPHRHVALNLDDPRIAEGMAIALKVLGDVATRCTQAGVRPVVVLIPTKELVFDPVVKDRAAQPLLDELVTQEQRARRQVREFLQAQGIDCIDTLPALRQCLAPLSAATQPYPASTDGHPNPAGHQAIATAIAEALSIPAP